ncbi:MAG TPA: hypothetical protein ENN52_05330 [Methanofollis liminatans]|uniref:Uncharacterized protein n=1 Tax=Methanofollis liminatans TaxID=2201 RepID=A0A831LFH8_9EURY|nr:hypothetical protein [Methanofollis liminatans]
MTPTKKTLTLGITVNLDNYENIRLEITGEVGSPEEADDLAGFLDATLARLGRGDEATAERVDTYRKRVFSMKATEKHPEPGVQTVLTPVAAEEPQEPVAKPVPEQAVAKDQPEPARAAAEPEPMPTPGPAAAMAKPLAHAPETPGKKVPEPAAAAPDLCEECKAAVTKTQKQMSQLFLNRTLCKACMDRLTHPR